MMINGRRKSRYGYKVTSVPEIDVSLVVFYLFLLIIRINLILNVLTKIKTANLEMTF